jgi:hypothetical protein
VQDAAYENLLASRRQVPHRRIAEPCAISFTHGRVQPEVVAHHFTQAGLSEAAIEWWIKSVTGRWRSPTTRRRASRKGDQPGRD